MFLILFSHPGLRKKELDGAQELVQKRKHNHLSAFALSLVSFQNKGVRVFRGWHIISKRGEAFNKLPQALGCAGLVLVFCRLCHLQQSGLSIVWHLRRLVWKLAESSFLPSRVPAHLALKESCLEAPWESYCPSEIMVDALKCLHNSIVHICQAWSTSAISKISKHGI